MEKKLQKALIATGIALGVISLILFGIGKYIDIQHGKQIKEHAMSKIPTIERKIQDMIDDDMDIVDIKTCFEYDGINFIELYVADTWHNSDDIQKKRFASDVRDSVKSILFEESFITARDRVGIYVYSHDEILLAESNMHDQIELKQ